MKQCTKCLEWKEETEFYKDVYKKDGMDYRCKICCNLKSFKSLCKNYRRKWSSSTLHQHKNRGCEIEISIDNVYEIAKKTDFCNVCGIKLNWEYNSKKGKTLSNSPSLDRINCENVINKNNIMIVCHKCNKTKQDRTMKEFVEYCKNIVKKFG